MHSNCSSKNTTPKISVIMGVFNGEKFLVRRLTPFWVRHMKILNL